MVRWLFRLPRAAVLFLPDFWLAGMWAAALWGLYTTGASPDLVLIALVLLDGAGLLIEEAVAAATGGFLEEGRKSGLNTAVRLFGRLFLSLLGLVFMGAIALIALFGLMMVSPRQGLMGLVIIARHLWIVAPLFRGSADAPITQEDKRRVERFLERWRSGRQLRWWGGIVAFVVVALAEVSSVVKPDADQVELVEFLSLAIYYGLNGLYGLFVAPLPESSTGDESERAAIAGLDLASALRGFVSGYLWMVPGILLVIFFTELVGPASPAGDLEGIFFFLGSWLLAAGAARAAGVTSSGIFNFGLARAGSSLLVAILLFLLFIGGILFIGILIQAILGPGSSLSPARVEPYLYPAVVLLGLYPAARLWPAYFNAFVYAEEMVSRKGPLYPGILAAWRMTEGSDRLRKGVAPSMAIATLSFAPYVLLLELVEPGWMRFALNVVFYWLLVPVNFFIAIERTAALRIPEYQQPED